MSKVHRISLCRLVFFSHETLEIVPYLRQVIGMHLFWDAFIWGCIRFGMNPNGIYTGMHSPSAYSCLAHSKTSINITGAKINCPEIHTYIWWTKAKMFPLACIMARSTFSVRLKIKMSGKVGKGNQGFQMEMFILALPLKMTSCPHSYYLITSSSF